jgi:protein translocase SecG subunit
MPIQTFFLVVAIILILIQNRGSGLSTAFGGNNEIYLTRRGIEKWVVNFTVVSIVAFVILRFVDLYF